MKNVILATALSLFVITACEKSDNQATVNKNRTTKITSSETTNSTRKTKVRTRKRKNSLRDQKKEDSLAKVETEKQKLATAKTNTVYKDRTVYRNSYGSNVSNSTSSQATTQKTGMSKAAKRYYNWYCRRSGCWCNTFTKKIEEQVL